MSGDEGSPPGEGTLGRIALKQVRITRAEYEAQQAEASTPRTPAPANLFNSLVPYLDLFCRLDDDELSRLGRVPPGIVRQLRRQVDDVERALSSYADLLPRLGDEELARLTHASERTIRFWRLCQPRGALGGQRAAARPEELASESGRRPSPGLESVTPRVATPAPEPAPAPAATDPFDDLTITRDDW